MRNLHSRKKMPTCLGWHGCLDVDVSASQASFASGAVDVEDDLNHSTIKALVCKNGSASKTQMREGGRPSMAPRHLNALERHLGRMPEHVSTVLLVAIISFVLRKLNTARY